MGLTPFDEEIAGLLEPVTRALLNSTRSGDTIMCGGCGPGMDSGMHKSAKEPNDLEKFFVERANAGDVEGLVALYEPDATLACDNNELVVGSGRIREFFLKFLADRPHFSPSVQAPPLCSGDLALTSSRHSNGDVSAEVARRQADGTWLWAVDQFTLGN